MTVFPFGGFPVRSASRPIETPTPTATIVPEAAAVIEVAPARVSDPPSPQPSPEATTPVPSGSTVDWLVILVPTELYSIDFEPLSIAEAGEWYRLLLVEDGYGLVVREGEDEWPMWLLMDEELVRHEVVDAG